MDLALAHVFATAKPKRHKKPSARVSPNATKHSHILSCYVPSNLVFSLRSKLGFFYINDHTNSLVVFDCVFTNFKVINCIKFISVSNNLCYFLCEESYLFRFFMNYFLPWAFFIFQPSNYFIIVRLWLSKYINFLYKLL